MSCYHSTYALYFLRCTNLQLVIKDTKYVIVIVHIPVSNFQRDFELASISKLKRIDGLKRINHPAYSSLLISIIGVLSASVRDLSCYKPGRVTLFSVAQMDDCAKILKETNQDF